MFWIYELHTGLTKALDPYMLIAWKKKINEE